MTDDIKVANDRVLELTADIITSYVTNNSMPSTGLASLIGQVHQALALLGSAAPAPTIVEAPTPAVPIKKSMTPDYLICLEDGKQFKSLKRHLMTHYGLTPDAYRAKWGLSPDYPMVAPNYAAARSALAKAAGLGQQRKKALAAAESAPARRARAKKTA